MRSCDTTPILYPERPMMLSQSLREHVDAAFTGLWIESHEHEDALEEIRSLAQQEEWRLMVWDAARGFGDGSPDPQAAVNAIPAVGDGSHTGLVVLLNFHRYLQDPGIVQGLANAVVAGKQSRSFAVIVSPVVQLPPELETLFAVLHHPLPDRVQLDRIARQVGVEEGDLPTDLGSVVDAAMGLTRMEAEGAFSISLARPLEEGERHRLRPRIVWEKRNEALRKSGLLEPLESQATFDGLGGMEPLKEFIRRSLRHDRPFNPRGIVLLGPPGVGKSSIAEAVGHEVGRRTMEMNVGNLMSRYVGDTEGNTRRVFQTIDASGPCVVLIDEGNHQMAGHGAEGDSGVMRRFFGAFQRWQARRTSDAYVILTANEIASLPGAFTRAGRFDAVFFVDLPDVAQRSAVWDIYERQYQVTGRRPPDENWSGAEIRQCCFTAAQLGISLVQAAQYIVPNSVTDAEGLERLRQWADGRCVSADRPGIYRRNQSMEREPRRKVRRDASMN